MAKIVLSEDQKSAISAFLEANKPAELANTYLFFIQHKFDVHPVLYPKNKTIYQSTDDTIRILEEKGELAHQTEIKIGTDTRAVNEQTRRIYICPFSGKVFGDNTHPNPQDAIYEWVSKCPENTERVGGLRVKRFHVSEDPEVIANYRAKTQARKAYTKQVWSSALSGKLYNSKEALIKDFRKNYLKPLTLVDVQGQNRFEIEEHFLKFLQDQLVEEKITAFVEALADHDEFLSYVEQWVEGE